MSENFGQYELLKKLATGGMGQVFLARENRPDGFERLVVVKRLLPHLSQEEEFVQMFLDEARIAAVLNHPNIVQIHELGQIDGVYFIAMEYVHGESLRAVSQRALQQHDDIPLPLKCRIIADAAAALDFAHKAKSPLGKPLSLIHRDISPQNILVALNGSVKLIDFGVAKAAGKINVTRAGNIKGKYAYMSPEQARGKELDSRSDVFGLGVVFYEVLTRGRLFKRESDNATLRAVVGSKVPAPSSLVREIPKQIDLIVLKALSKRRQDRFQTAEEMRLAINEFLTQHRLQTSTSHLAAFMRWLYGDELSDVRLSVDQTDCSVSPRKSPTRKKTRP